MTRLTLDVITILSTLKVLLQNGERAHFPMFINVGRIVPTPTTQKCVFPFFYTQF